MNLHAIAGPIVAAVNPQLLVDVRISTGPGPTAADGTRPPTYATPGAFTASIADDVLTVTAISAGKLQVGQTIAGAGVAVGTSIAALGTGTGAAGTYVLDRKGQTVGSEAMTSSLIIPGQIQPTTWRDLQQLEALNVSGVRWKVYLNGKVDGIVRPEKKGGDLIVVSSGPHAGTWLVAQVLEQFPDWVCAAITLQNGG